MAPVADPAPLLRALVGRLGNQDLRRLARSDDGRDAAEHLAALWQIRATGLIPRPLGWVPGEVLALNCHLRPEDTALYGNAERLWAHLVRAFACTAFLAGVLGDDSPLQNSHDQMIRLVESLDSLGGLEWEAAAFTAWMTGVLKPSEPSEQVFAGLAQLWATLRLGEVVPDKAISDLLDWICEREAALVAEWAEDSGTRPPRWLLGATRGAFRRENVRAWEDLGRRLASWPLPGRPAALVDYVRLVGEALAGM